MSKLEELTRPIIGIENRTAQEVFDIMCDRITAALADMPVPDVNVKPLEWYDTTERNAYGQFLRFAVTAFGRYRVLRGSQGRFEVYFGTSPFSCAMETLEEAEAWGQTDYEARILSALTPPADLAAENGRLRMALEPFAEYARQNEVWLSKNDEAELSHATLDDMPKTGWIRGARAALEHKP